MSTVVIRQGTTVRKATGQHPKVALVSEAGPRIVLPFAPVEGTHSGWNGRITVQDRPGRAPLTLDDGPALATYGFTTLLARVDGSPVEDLILALKKMAAASDRITLTNVSPREAGPWRIETMTVAPVRRQHGSNRITQANLTVGLLEPSQANPKIGPVSGGSAGKGDKDKPKFYVVKKGDTLRKIAVKFYDDPAVWKEIAKANGIKEAGNLKVGRKLKLPDVITSATYANPLAGD